MAYIAGQTVVDTWDEYGKRGTQYRKLWVHIPIGLSFSLRLTYRRHLILHRSPSKRREKRRPIGSGSRPQHHGWPGPAPPLCTRLQRLCARLRKNKPSGGSNKASNVAKNVPQSATFSSLCTASQPHNAPMTQQAPAPKKVHDILSKRAFGFGDCL